MVMAGYLKHYLASKSTEEKAALLREVLAAFDVPELHLAIRLAEEELVQRLPPIAAQAHKPFIEV